MVWTVGLVGVLRFDALFRGGLREGRRVECRDFAPCLCLGLSSDVLLVLWRSFFRDEDDAAQAWRPRR